MEKLRTLDLPMAKRVYGDIVADKAAANGDKPFLVFEGRSFSYRDIHEITDRLAAGFHRAGIRFGQHVAILLNNGPEILWTYMALAKIGAVSVPVNTAAKGDLLAYYLNQSQSVAVVVEDGLVERLAAVLPQCAGVRCAIVTGDSAAGDGLAIDRHAFAALERDAGPRPAVTVRYNDVFCLFYTSGTTGPSKGNVMLHSTAVTGAMGHVEYFGYRPDDVMYICLPLFHGNAMNTGCMPAYLADATVHLSRRFSASSFWDDVRAAGATQFNLLGSMTNILWNQPPGPRDRDHKVRQCMMVPIPDFGREFEARFGIKLTSVYALTDFGNVTMLSPRHPPEKFRSGGLPKPEVEVAILDEEDNPLPANAAGEICLRNRVAWVSSQGYFNMPEATLKANRNLWFHTGDRGRLDEDGYLYFVDRMKDAIRRRGENISSWEVEQIVAGHPDVVDVAAFAVRSEMSEDEVMISVVLRDGATFDPAGLVEYCQHNMAYFMVPRFIEAVAALPRTMTEKVQKFRLREEAERRLPEIWDREKAGITLIR